MLTKGTDNNISKLIHQLLDDYKKTLDSTKFIEKISTQSRMLSLNSMIEASRIGQAGRGFMVISQQIQNFADSNQKANKENQDNIKGLNNKINSIVGVRTADVAFDLIDKIDRNLFERNCDVQAWAGFEAIVDFASSPSAELALKVTSLLSNLHRIYEFYHDIFMVDKDGKIVASAVHKNALGSEVSQTDWFSVAKQSKDCYVTDMHYSDLVNDYAVSYSCKITDEKGNFLGVLSTRFNWEFIYDIIDKAKISPQSEIYVINKQGIVIASKDRSLVLKQNLIDKYPIVRPVLKKENYGYAMETDAHHMLTTVYGYAHTKGYNNYAGKDWSVVVKEII